MTTYLADSADLTDVADAIRAKGGTSAALAWPGGFVDAIGAIETGGGGGGWTEYVIEPTFDGVMMYEFHLSDAGLSYSDFAVGATSLMWFEVTQDLDLLVWLDENDDDDFDLQIPAGTCLQCTAVETKATLKMAYSAFTLGASGAYGFLGWVCSSDGTVTSTLSGEPNRGAATSAPAFKNRNNGAIVDAYSYATERTRLHILKAS